MYVGHSLSLFWRHRLLVKQTRSANCPITAVWMSHLVQRGEHPHSYFLYVWRLVKLRRQYLCKLSLYSFVLHSMNYVPLWRSFTKGFSYIPLNKCTDVAFRLMTLQKYDPWPFTYKWPQNLYKYFNEKFNLILFSW